MRAKGEGTIRYDKTKKLWVWLGYYITPSREKKRKAIYGKTKKEVCVKAYKWRIELATNKLPCDGSMTVKEWSDEWINICQNKWRLKTKQQYERYIELYINEYIGDEKLKNVTTLTIDRLLNLLLERLAPDTVAGVRRRIITMLNAAVRYGYLLRNPATDTNSIELKAREIEVFTEDELMRILDIARNNIQTKKELSERWFLTYSRYIQILLLINSGCREMEIFGLTWDKVDFDNKRIVIQKALVVVTGQKPFLGDVKTAKGHRNIKLPDNVMNELAIWKQEQQKYADKWQNLFDNKLKLVTPNSVGGAMSPSNYIARFWDPLLKQANIKYRNIHNIRHSHASLLLQKGTSPVIVSQRLGHSAVSVTMNVYAHALPDMQDEAVKNLNKMKWQEPANKEQEKDENIM